MSELRALLNDYRGEKTPDEFAFEVNTELIKTGDRSLLIPSASMYSYLNGTRNITGKGAKSLAIFFHRKGNLDMVNAITEVTLGIPYGSRNGHSIAA